MPKVRSASPTPTLKAPQATSLFAAKFRPPPPLPYARPPPKVLLLWNAAIVAAFLQQPELLAALSSPTNELHLLIATIFASRPPLDPPCPPCEYAAFSIRALRAAKPLRSASLDRAIAARLALERTLRLEAKRIRLNVTLTKAPQVRVALFVCASFSARRLSPTKLYPPPHQFIAQSTRMKRSWDTPLAEASTTDLRKPLCGTHVLDRRRLQLVIPAELSCAVYDEHSRALILVVVRQFCSNAAILSAIALIGERVLATRRSVRRRDPGTLVQVGHTGGSLSKPEFGFARNFLSRAKGAENEEKENRREVGDVLCYAWLRASATFPSEVTDDIAGFYEATGIPLYDAEWPSESTSPTMDFKLGFGGSVLEFSGLQKPPSCGVFAAGYAAPVHLEQQDHQWAIGWNYLRRGTKLSGGHFYLSDYGIEMIAAEDTAWSWKPSLLHTTGLSNAYPGSSSRLEGLAFVTPVRLAAAFAKWVPK